MRATTEFFKMPRDGVIPPGEGVMGVTNKEEARLRVELAAVEKERNRAQANWDKTRERLAAVEKERDEARRELAESDYHGKMLTETMDDLKGQIQILEEVRTASEERLEKVREARAWAGEMASHAEYGFHEMCDRLDRALNETASEGERCGGSGWIRSSDGYAKYTRRCPGCPDCGEGE